MKYNKKLEKNSGQQRFYSTEMKLEKYFRKFSAMNFFFGRSFFFKKRFDQSFNLYAGEFPNINLKQYYEVDHFCRKILELTLEEYAVVAERCIQKSDELRFKAVELIALIGLFLSILGLVASTQSINPELSKAILAIAILGSGVLVAFSALAKIPVDVILNGQSNRLKKLADILKDIPLNKEYQRFKAQKDNGL